MLCPISLSHVSVRLYCDVISLQVVFSYIIFLQWFYYNDLYHVLGLVMVLLSLSVRLRHLICATVGPAWTGSLPLDKALSIA